MRTTILEQVTTVLTNAKRPMRYADILDKMMGTNPASLDTILSLASKTGTISRRPVQVIEGSKFEYFMPTLNQVVKSAVKGSKIDSMEVFLAVQSVLPNAKKASVDAALCKLAKAGEIQKSKNPMTDTNTISSQSKFLYSAK